jgi:tripartite-type tricarboxylate transporter receptor subunit TctC
MAARNASNRLLCLWAASALLGLLSAGCSARADAIADFYGRKTVTAIAGFPPGGGYDTYVRLLARYFGRFIPGHPSVVPSNMPGAGSMTAANHIYNDQPNDGTVLGMFASSAAMEPLLGNKAALFDPAKFSWIGSMSQDIAYCGVWQGPGAPATFDAMLHQETIFGGGAPAAITYQHPMILKNVLGADIRVIPGYAGTRDIDLAMHRGEVNGECGLYASSIRSQYRDDIESGRLKLVIQMGSRRSTEFGAIPSVFDYARTEDDRAVLELHFKQLVLGRPLAGPPGIPPDRLAALRAAFMMTMKDNNFLAEADKIGLDIDPATADEVMDLLRHFATFSPAIFERARQAIGR